MTKKDINRAKYAGADFDTHLDDLRARSQVRFASSFNDLALSGLGSMLLDLVASGLDSMSFYLDRRTTEAYLPTARTPAAVARLTRGLGYKMRAATASSVDVQLYVGTEVGVPVPVLKGRQLQGPNGLIFELGESVTFPANTPATDVRTVVAFEGQTFTETFVSDGKANQVFELRRVPDGKFIAEGTTVVNVDGSLFSESEFFLFESTNQFELDPAADPPTISFGDGVAGNIPVTGGTITVTYVATSGVDGQVASGTIKSLVSPLVVAATTINLVVNNPEGSVGGSPIESIEEAKVNASKVFKTRDVAVTLSDYEALASSYSDPLFGRVAEAQALSSRSAAEDLVVQAELSAIGAAVTNATAPNNIIPTTLVPAVEAQLALITAEKTVLEAQIAELDAQLINITNGTSDARLSAQSVKDTNNQIIEVDADDILSLVTDGKAAIDAITATTGTSTLTVSDKDALKAYLDRITTEATSIKAGVAANTVTLDTIVSSLNTVKTAESSLTTAGTGTSALLANAATGIGTANTAAITAAVAISSSVTDTSNDVLAATSNINQHLDKLLASDCKANLVTVPILTRDASGFLAGPSRGLVASLETFLTARKEVTHSVEVVSGAEFLVPAVVTVHVGVREGSSEAQIKQTVENTLDAVLRSMEFGEDLYNSHLDSILQKVTGVGFLNTTINGHTSNGSTSTSLLTGGNLVVPDSKVITKGTVTVTTELVPASVGADL